jgi:hypothetical protein
VSIVPAADPSFGWQEAAIGYLVVALAAFLVTWVVTDLLGVRRTPYIAILAVVVGSLGAWYLSWSGTSFTELVRTNAVWGLAAGLVVAVLVTPLVRRLPRGSAPTGPRLAGRIAWEDVVYGTAEALLLAAYPVLTIWHAATAAGWTDTGAGKVTAGSLAVLGSLLVILVHHMGYEEFRSRGAGRMLAGALFACGLQALAFLLTSSVLAPVVAHIALHLELTMRGAEMPPTPKTSIGRGGRGGSDGDLAGSVRRGGTLAREG